MTKNVKRLLLSARRGNKRWLAVYYRARVTVIVPAFQCGARIASVLSTMPRFVDEVFVVDDGSTDETGLLARRVAAERAGSGPAVRVLRHEANRGVGAALATGYAAGYAAGAEVLAVMAGDGQMHPDDLAGLVAPVARGEADYAKGNRLGHEALWRRMPWTRLVGNVALSALTRAATGLWHVGDSQCGYTALHRRVLERLDPASMWTRYGYPNHLLGALAQAGFRVRDVPVRPVYAGERSGVKLRDAVVTVPAILFHVARARWRAEGVPVLRAAPGSAVAQKAAARLHGGFAPLGAPLTQSS